jgi:hypothetical protein
MLVNLSTDLEPQNPKLKPSFKVFKRYFHLKTAFNPSKGRFKVASFMKILLLIMKKLQPQKMSIFRKIWWFLNKKRGRNDLFLICAPLTDERCNYNAMIEYVTIRKLKG